MIESTIEYVSATVYPAAIALLPERMDSLEAKAMVLAIGSQESGFAHRKQVGGPAQGFWQFETGGVNGVLSHPATKPVIEAILPAIVVKPWEVYDALIYHDVLACVMARLLLWTYPAALPKRDNLAGGWNQYLDCWRPGKPHREVWPGNFDKAWQIVGGS